jgi:hypothetical protein
MPVAKHRTSPVGSERGRSLTNAELDDLIWDIAVGRPTRVVLDTDVKRATAVAVRRKIDEALGRKQISGAPE